MTMSDYTPTIMIKVRSDHLIGTGHFFRSLELARKLKEHFQVIFHLNQNSYLENILKQEGIRYFTEDDVISIVKQGDITSLFFDEPNDDEGLFEVLKKESPGLTIIAMGYFNYDNKWVDVIINLINHHPEKRRPSAKHIQYYEGLQYAIVRSEFERIMGQEKVINSPVQNILVAFGGVDMSGNTVKALTLLEQVGVKDLNLDIILGSFYDHKNRPIIQNILQNMKCKAHIHRTVSNMPEHMFGADLAFCGGGVTLIELLAVGTPTIVIPQNLRERGFGHKLQQEGAVKLLDESAPITDNIIHVAEIINSTQQRRTMSEAGRALIDGSGKERICTIIMRAMEQANLCQSGSGKRKQLSKVRREG